MPEQLSFAGFEPAPWWPPVAQGRNKPKVWRDMLLLLAHVEASAADAATRTCRSLIRRHDLRVSPQANFHVTLHPIGDFALTPSSVLNLLKGLGDEIRLPPFETVWDRVMSWHGKADSCPLVMCPSTGGAELVELHRALRSALDLAAPGRFPSWNFNPHVTLTRARRIDEQAIPPIRWMVREFSLVRSIQEARRHEVLKSWLLRA
jgi:RNA 2',3'-cyclic 3'-phosphodiesterase